MSIGIRETLVVVGLLSTLAVACVPDWPSLESSGVGAGTTSSGPEGGAGTISSGPARRGCTVPKDCPGVNDICMKRTCDKGMCGVSYADAGVPADMPPPVIHAHTHRIEVCSTFACDGDGGVVVASVHTCGVGTSCCGNYCCPVGGPSPWRPPVE